MGFDNKNNRVDSVTRISMISKTTDIQTVKNWPPKTTTERPRYVSWRAVAGFTTHLGTSCKEPNVEVRQLLDRVVASDKMQLESYLIL